MVGLMLVHRLRRRPNIESMYRACWEEPIPICQYHVGAAPHHVYQSDISGREI